MKKAFETDLPPNRAYVGWDNYEEEPSVFFRYVDTTRTCILHSLWANKMPWGNIVDIFVLNPLPKDSQKWDDYHKTMRRFGAYVMDTHLLVNNKVSILAYVFDCLIGKIKGSDYVKNKLYKELSKYNEDDCTHFSYLHARVHSIYPKEMFQAPRYVLFEGHMLPVPTLAEEHFRILFGDDWYMIPPDSGKITHFAQHDMKRSYREYVYDFLRYTNLPKLKKHSRRAKFLKMLRAKVQARYYKKAAQLRARYVWSKTKDTNRANEGEG